MSFPARLQKLWHKTPSDTPDLRKSDSSSKTQPAETAGDPQLNFMAGARDFIIKKMIVSGGKGTDEGPKTLEILKEQTIPGAEYNSAERDPPPSCHPDTRTSIRNELRGHVTKVNIGTRIIWIHGPAGVGKSAIMQSLVEEMVKTMPSLVCATLFFSRPNHRDDPQKVFTTLAYSLAVANPEYRQYIGKRLKADPKCLKKSLDNQFETLFVTPFIEKRVSAGSQRWIVFLDGLDECQNTKHSDNQFRIANLIGDSILHYAGSTPFIWVIASRPEENLKEAWSDIQDRFQARASELWELPIPVDSDEATRDVERFLHREFEAIKKNNAIIPRQSRWPSDGDFDRVAKKSSGLFVFASTVTKYVSEENPVHRLKAVIASIDQADKHPTTTDENPYLTVDLLYSAIIFDIPKRLLPIAKSLIGFYQLADATVVHQKRDQKIGLVEACNILGLPQDEAYAALLKLQSVLICPSPETAQVNGLKFFHASFPDYLLDRSRSQDYHVNLDEEFTNVWRRYTTIIEESMTTHEYAGISVSWLPDDDASCLGQFQKQLFHTAQHAWFTILTNNSSSQTVTRSLQVDVPELIEAFRRLGLAFLTRDEPPIEKFLDWLSEHAPTEFRDRMLSQTLTLNELDTERLFKSLCFRPRYQYVVKLSMKDVDLSASFKSFDDPQWERARAVLWTSSGEFGPLVKASNVKNVCVTVVGIEPSNRYAIIGPLEAERRFYILPYNVT